MEPVVLRYGNTNTYFLKGKQGGLLLETMKTVTADEIRAAGYPANIKRKW